ncbi:MAG: pantoate--beta-alanine ligase [Actinobacteria bacterium]|nr:MAG: pantoate--beta-alanine ligase [Actinomycetota bacterium]
MRRARTIAGLRAALEPYREGEIGLVPTMGALHPGHVSLFRAARHECDAVVATIFVNPAQFGPADDFERYPRDLERDAGIAEEAAVDLLFVPSVDELFPEGFQTSVDVEELSKGLEGSARPGHFRAVATICLKLFNIVRPARAYFGQKDAQQAEIVERMVRDLNLELEVRVLPTVRDEDGLAFSSRNAYLSAEERTAARALPRALFAAEAAYRKGEDAVEAASSFLAEEPGLETEYVELAQLNGRLVLAAAVRAGSARLIDNVVLKGAAEAIPLPNPEEDA